MNPDINLATVWIQQGYLRRFRTETLGVSRFFMAELVGVDPNTYNAWEAGKRQRLWKRTAARLEQFIRLAQREVDEYGPVTNKTPLPIAAARMGISLDEALRRYRNGDLEAEDRGVLGLWIHNA